MLSLSMEMNSLKWPLRMKDFPRMIREKNYKNGYQKDKLYLLEPPQLRN